jgi:hypothetical protein
VLAQRTITNAAVNSAARFVLAERGVAVERKALAIKPRP